MFDFSKLEIKTCPEGYEEAIFTDPYCDGHGHDCLQYDWPPPWLMVLGILLILFMLNKNREAERREELEKREKLRREENIG